MWHRHRRRRLGVKTAHRKALLRNLVRNLALNRQIETTLARAKETSRLADRMVTLAKAGTLSARRQLIRRLGSAEMAKVFMDRIAPCFKERNGGYTRVLKTRTRLGDAANMALVEFSVPIEMAQKDQKPKKEKKQKPAKPLLEEKEVQKEIKTHPEKGPSPKVKEEKEETQKRGGFLSKLRKFLTGDE